MTGRENILQELKELGSPLSELTYQTGYQVPADYFDTLPARIMQRIKAVDAADPETELKELSPLLAGIPRKAPYSAPEGYFEKLEAPADEVLSPALASLRTINPYSVPEGYFEKLPSLMAGKVTKQPAKIVSLSPRKWMRYAVAAMMVGLVATVGFLVLNQDGNQNNPTAQVKKSLRKVSTDEINLFIEQTGITGTEMVKAETKNEIKDLLKDVSDQEIQDFLDEAQPFIDDDDELFLN